MSQYFSEPYRTFRRDINVKVDLSDHATKTDFKNAKIKQRGLADKSAIAGFINNADLEKK